jgi:hypothetical protein
MQNYAGNPKKRSPGNLQEVENNIEMDLKMELPNFG